LAYISAAESISVPSTTFT